MKIILFCISRPVSVLAAAAGILLFGTVAFLHLGVELLPDLRIPLVRVATAFPGMAAEDVENLVTRPLENALSPVRGLRGIQSVTKEEVSLIDLRFDWTKDFRTAAAEVREKVDAVYPCLPFGIDRPLVVTEDLNARPVMALALSPSPGRSLRDAGELAKREISAALARIPGVSSVDIVGAGKTEILVQADREKLAGTGMSIRDLAEIIAAATADRPAGKILEAGREHPVTVRSGIDTAEKLRRLPLTAGPRSGAAFTLGDLARVTEGPGETGSFFLADGKLCVGILIGGTPEAGSRAAARAVLAELPRLRDRYRREVEIRVASDSSREIDAALRGLPRAAGLGIASVFAALTVIFGGWTIPLIVSASVPLCCAATFLFMRFTGMSLNVVSLSGMTLGIGMIVDNSIVVVEALLDRGRISPREAARRVRETALAIFPSTATTVLVFLPILFIPGVVGALFADLAAVLSFLLGVSLIFALTLTPALAVLISPAPSPGPGILGGFGGLYARYLRAALRRPWMPLTIFLVLIAIGAGTFLRLPRAVMPRRDAELLELTAAFPPGSLIADTLEESRKLSLRFLEIPGVEGVWAEAGGDEDSPIDRGEAGRNPWTVRFRLGLKGRPAGEAARDITAALTGTAALRDGPSPPEDPVSRLLGARKGHALRLSGGSREELLRRGEEIRRRLGGEGLVAGVFMDTEKTLPRVDYRLDPVAAAFHHIGAGEALDILQTSLRGRIAAGFRRDDREIGVRVRLGTGKPAMFPDLSAIPLPGKGGFIPAGETGSFDRGFCFPELHRTDRVPSVTLTFDPAPGAESALERMLAAEPRAELLSRSGLRTEAKSALLVFALAALMMYLLLGAQFESVLVPLLLLLSFPLSAAGSFPMLLAFGYSLNVNSFLGILILLGTTINSPILLTAAYGGGGPRRIVEESVRRLRPLTATVATTLTALVPVLLNRGGENILQSNTAASLAGGLAAGTAAILLVYPPLYLFATGRRRRGS